MPTVEEVQSIVKEKNVRFIQCWFTDILGRLKSFTISPSELNEALQEGMGFDGSSIEGFMRIEESDMIAKPDPETFQIIPWKVDGNTTARMFCDILTPDKNPYEGDPRYVLKRILGKAKEMGYTFYVGPELEYFYFASSNSPNRLDEGGYFDGQPIDMGEEVREKTVMALESMGITVEYSHHEVAYSQHEIDLKYRDGLTMADTVMTHRLVVKEIARQNELYATFMPKPVMGINGSGMHTHQSLFSGGKNAFYDKDDPFHLSSVAKFYIAGLLRHSREISAICNQWVNSYKRLVPGYEAPVYISWARRNRSTLIRVPMYKPDKEKSMRIEFRSPDPACNPYLAFAAMLAAGLKGIECKYELPEPVEEDIYHMDEKRRQELNIQSLPASLFEAISELESSELLRETLGNHVFYKFISNKKAEWDEFRIHVSQYEIEKYLPIL